MKPRQETSRPLQKWAVSAGWVYYTLLFGWLVAYALGGDWDGLLVPVNALAVWLFLPLPGFLVLAGLTRRIELWLAGAAGLAASLFLWGGLFLPGPQPAAALEGEPTPSLRVMTYNVYGFNQDSAGVAAAIRSANPDAVCFQELSPEMAAALVAALDNDYPYQLLDPQPRVDGMGTISKYPLSLGSRSLPGRWIGAPQVLEIAWNGRMIELVNFHMHPPGQLAPGPLRQRHNLRQQQAAALARFAQGSDRPLILAGDANAGELNDAYKTITSTGLRDAWREAGQGMGFTFPRQLAGFSPAWMARIDHVFLSPEWQILGSRLAPADNGSDHRAVMVEARVTAGPPSR
jgi:vancomycin resistance protein VanJ